jgi:hypothetical protein
MCFRDQVEVAAAGPARLELGQGMKGWTINGSVAISALDLQNSGWFCRHLQNRPKKHSIFKYFVGG